MELRGIEPAWVSDTILHPDWTEPDPIAGRERRFRAIGAFGGRVLRVMTEEQDDNVLVITACFDRAATKRRLTP